MCVNLFVDDDLLFIEGDYLANIKVTTKELVMCNFSII